MFVAPSRMSRPVRRSARVAASHDSARHSSTQKRAGDVPVESKVAKKSKASGSEASSSSAVIQNGVGRTEFKQPEGPAMPVHKGATTTAAAAAAATPSAIGDNKAPPLTPTSSDINLMRTSYYTRDDGQNDPKVDRAVEPHVTNAILVTPGGTQKMAYPNSVPAPQSSLWSASRSELPQPVATTGNLLDKAYAHLIKVDPGMKELIERHHCSAFSAQGLAENIDPFRSLCGSIISQQVSGAAARSISSKFVALFDTEVGQPGEIEKCVFPTPAQVAGSDIARLRLAGLSQRKAEYIHGLAEKFRDGELSADMLMTASDAEVMEKLIAVRGLGKWSVEMFACFGLKRTDILSTGDLGVQRGMAAYFGKDVNKLKKAKGGGKWKYMSEKEMLDKSAKYAPYRSLFMWYMWRVEDVNVTVMQNPG